MLIVCTKLVVSSFSHFNAENHRYMYILNRQIDHFLYTGNVLSDWRKSLEGGCRMKPRHKYVTYIANFENLRWQMTTLKVT